MDRGPLLSLTDLQTGEMEDFRLIRQDSSQDCWMLVKKKNVDPHRLTRNVKKLQNLQRRVMKQERASSPVHKTPGKVT